MKYTNQNRSPLFRLLSIFLFLFLSNFSEANETLIGAGKHEISGPFTRRPMMGYADLNQTTEGIHTRLFSRAFVIENPARDTRITFVVTDTAMVFYPIKNEVLRRLDRLFPGKYNDANLMIMATHTHSAPGGFSHYDLFNITTFGFDHQNYESIVSGIVQSIENAYQRLQAGRVLFEQGDLEGVSKNRSLVAYEENPDRDSYSTNTDNQMTLLKLESNQGETLGVLSWFALHAVSMSKKNKLISADSNGASSRLMEKYLPSGAIAAFANSNEGDASPDIFSVQMSDFQKTETIGFFRFDYARELLNHGLEQLEPDLRAVHSWSYMPSRLVPEEFTELGYAVNLCRPAMGYSFIAGAEDGRSGLPGFWEGMKQGDDLSAAFPIRAGAGILGFVLGANRSGNPCHFPKPVILSQTPLNRFLIPDTIPLQLVTIGRLAIIAAPAEFTTMAGRRLKSIVAENLREAGITAVAFAGLANEYSGYVTTPQEYRTQQYEGAFTLYGNQTLNAYREEFTKLSQHIRKSPYVSIGNPPPRRGAPLLDWLVRPTFDGKKIHESWGEALIQPRSTYQTGETVRAAFRGADPYSSIGKLPTLFVVEKRQGSQWLPIAKDDDLTTTLLWKQDRSLGCIECSTIDTYWRISPETAPGEYRIRHVGIRKSFWFGQLKHYEGISRAFQVR